MTTSTPSAAKTTPTWRHWIALVLLGLPLFMMAADFTAVFLAVPQITADLDPSTTQLLWIVHIGELVAAGTLITMGWLTNRLGPRTLLLLALGLYTTASALAAFAPSPETLLAARVLIGLATAAASPAALAMLRVLFSSPRHYGIAFAVVMGAFPVGAALGPPITGLLLEHFWWGSAFLVNVPVGAAALVGGLWLFPAAAHRTKDRIDITSVVISMAAVMLTVYGLQEIADRGLNLAYVLSIVAGGVLGLWFLRRQRRIANPLLDLGLFAIKVLRVLVIFFVLSSVAFMAADFILIQHLQIVTGVSPGTLGLMLALPGAAAIASTALTPALTRRFSPTVIMGAGIGLGLMGVGLILFAVLLGLEPWVIAAGMTVTTFALSPPMVLGAQLMIMVVPVHQTGPAAAVQDIGASLGAAAGIGLLGSLATLVFRERIPSAAADGVATAELVDAADSPGAAVAYAQSLGTEAADQLLPVIQEAWSWGTIAVFVVALMFGGLLLVVMLRGLRGVQIPDDEDAGSVAPDAEPAWLGHD